MKKILIVIGFFGIVMAQETIRINFAALVNDQPAACGIIYNDIGLRDSKIEFQDLRFYVSDLRLINAAGEEVPLTLDQDGMWQYQNVALLDFEDASGLCSQSGNAALNSVVTGTVPAGDYTGLAFTLGVPFEYNHADVTMAPAPLNISSLWWNWQGGYKHLRIDLMSHSAMMASMSNHSQQAASAETAETSSEHGGTAMAGFWPIHLGSTGCASEATTIAPATSCSTPNTIAVRFEQFDASQDVVVADLGSLLKGVDVSQSLELMPPGCMSGPSDPDCAGLFKNLNLASDSSGQMLFWISR